jgi:poly-gamma-glutamate synthesis protein (capsule biosynthesis protein)
MTSGAYMKNLVIFAALFLFITIASAAEQDIRMLFVGDVMLDEVPGKVIKQGGNPFRSFDALFKRADVRIGNLECVVGNTGKAEDKPYVFRAHPRVTKLLKRYFNAVSLANNHTGDYGPVAFSNMLDILDRDGVAYFGGGKEIRSAHQPYIVEIKGKKIAILGYNEFFPRSFEALSDRAGTAWSDDDYVVHDIKKAKNEYHADIVIVYPHWGWEYEKQATSRQERLAHLMIDAGADVIVGGHPHVTQNIEVYKGKPIFYSLGNFVFNGFDDDDANTGWALELLISPASELSWNIHVAKLNKQGLPILTSP